MKKEINNIKILSEHTQKNEVSLFIGFKGVESSIFRALENFHGEEILAMGVRFSKDKKFNILWEKWHHLREKRKIRCRIILSEIDKEIFRKFRNTQTRKLEGITPSAITVLGDIVLIQNYGHEVSCIYIQNEDTAESFRTFFETLWKLAKK